MHSADTGVVLEARTPIDRNGHQRTTARRERKDKPQPQGRPQLQKYRGLASATGPPNCSWLGRPHRFQQSHSACNAAVSQCGSRPAGPAGPVHALRQIGLSTRTTARAKRLQPWQWAAQRSRVAADGHVGIHCFAPTMRLLRLLWRRVCRLHPEAKILSLYPGQTRHRLGLPTQ